MASPVLGGDRRWNSTRRSGMLGKVAVPKPINLPSQKLENHGLDPNVEIVPKGTVSWGSRSSPNQNAWGSSPALSSSPTADGAVCPAHLNSRPSSGGSGTRPSTAGSERSHDVASSAWGTNLRPSSASGLVASSHSSGSLRPRSAETRPGSSQLSRFAESVAENSTAQGGSGNTERLSSPSSFTLSSGDFPSLHFDKSSESNLRQGHSSHERPSSSSSKAATQDRAETSSPDGGYIDVIGEKGVRTWSRDEPLYPGTRPQPNIEKWQKDSQQALAYTNPSAPQQHFEHWHGPSVQNAPPDGSWYRGGPPPGPYGLAGPPGSYSIDPPPYGYYQPQSPIPVRPVLNQQTSPRPGIGAGGYGPSKGDSWRPHTPESFPVPSHPVMPVRYPGPMPPYDGYYGPPRMNFCNQSERDDPVRGMASGHGQHLYHRYQNQNAHPDSGNFHARPYSYGPAAAKGQVDSTHAHDPGHRGPYKVLLKQHDGWGESDAEQNKEHSGHMQQSERENVRQASPKKKSEWEADSKEDKAIDLKPISRDEASQFDQLPETVSKHNAIDKSFLRKQETTENLRQGSQFPPEKKNVTLIDKIEGLNSKSRISDTREDTAPLLPTREDKVKRSKTSNEATCNGGPTEKAHKGSMSCAPFSKDAVGDNKGEIGSEIIFGAIPRLADPVSMEAVNNGPYIQRRVIQGTQGKGGDYRGRARFSSQESGEWKKKPTPESDSSCSLVKSSEIFSQELTDEHELKVSNKAGDKFDSVDYKAQRAKLKEIATQRAKEEEERTREQKAKALAKLEELNRRTLGDNVLPKSDGSKLLPKHEELPIHGDKTVKNAVVSEMSACMTQTSNSSIQSRINVSEKDGELVNHPAIKFTEVSGFANHEMDVASTSSISSSQVVDNSHSEGSALQLHDNGSSNQKQIGRHRRRNNISNDKNRGEGSISSGSTAKAPVEANANAFGESISVSNILNVDDSSSQHKKKHTRNSKSKHKVNDASVESGLLASAPVEGNSIKPSVESGRVKWSETFVQDIRPVLVANTVELRGCPEVVPTIEKALDKQIEVAPGKKNGNQWKPQSARKVSRNSQAVRLTEKIHGNETVVWAPVQPLNKQQQSFEQVGQIEGHQPSGKGGNGMGSSVKTKRAEMERYVPKPVAKELSLQSNLQVPLRSPPLSSISDEMSSSGNDICAVGTENSGTDARNIENKQNKHGKKHASWRQRNPIESHVGLDGSREESLFSSDVGEAVEKLAYEHQPSDSDIKSHKWQDHGMYTGGQCEKVMSIEQVSGRAAAKDHGVSGRGRRQTSRFGKGGDHYQNVSEELNKDFDKPIPVEQGIHTPAVEIHVWDGKKDLKPENRQVMGSNENQYGSRGSGSQKVTVQVVTSLTKDESSQVQPFPSPQVEMQKHTVSVTTHSRHQDTKFVKKRKDSLKEGHDCLTQGVAENTDFQIEKQQASWDMRKQSQHNGRFQRGHGGSLHGGGGWGGSGLETHKQQGPLNGDRRKHHNSHYEYQPVESQYKKSSNVFSDSAATEEVTCESSGLRFKERSQNISRRGHYHGRNGGAGVSRIAAS